MATEEQAAFRGRIEALFAHYLDGQDGPPDVSLEHVCQRWAGCDAKSLLATLSPAALRAASLSRLPDAPWRALAIRPSAGRHSPKQLRYGVHASPVGEALIVFNEQGIHYLSFLRQGEDPWSRLRAALPEATCEPDPAIVAEWGRRCFERLEDPIPLCLPGTPFQQRVWRTLARVPAGRVIDYGQLARLAGHPGAARAVGSAMAANPVAWLIPCHRVIGAGGRLGHYQPGPVRKAMLLAWERAVLAGRAQRHGPSSS
jgi:AraC family transcriptional regulator of adaptative response/methylated-DNA-[protein]-cysteine methyltransferase